MKRTDFISRTRAFIASPILQLSTEFRGSLNNFTEYVSHHLPRRRGRPQGTGKQQKEDLPRLDRITDLMKSEQIKRFTAARCVVKEGRADGTIDEPTSDKNIADRLAKKHRDMFG